MKYVILIHSNPQPWGHPTGDFIAEQKALTAEQFAQDERGEVYALTSISTGPVGGHDKIYRILPAD